MKSHLQIVFTVIVLAPLALLVWIGLRLNADEHRALFDHVHDMELDQLRDLNKSIRSVMETRKREIIEFMDKLAAGKAGVDTNREAREFSRKEPLVRQVFVLSRDCGRIHPPLTDPMSSAERDFVARASSVWPDWVALCRSSSSPKVHDDMESMQALEVSSEGSENGWYTWRWGGASADLVLWDKPKGGGLVGAELNSIALLSDIVGALPATDHEPSRVDDRTVLLDGSGKVLYQWGNFQPEKSAKPMAELSLDPPLGHWRLARYQSEEHLENILGASITFGMLAALFVAGLGLLGLAAYFLRQHGRMMREAANRISFVNRVSHELRTPLTNIMLYSDILQDHLGDDEKKDKRHAEIISSESGRLGRLIDNVLAFSRKQSKGLRVHRGRASVDETIAAVLDNFAPSLEQKGIGVEFHGDAAQLVNLDKDALSQVLGNLLSNVEKYVPKGARVNISSENKGQYSVIRVCDNGPGIPKKMEKKIFEPFYRLSNRLTDGVSGTGLGLGIARDLASLHGGDLILISKSKGACFEIIFDTSSSDTDSTNKKTRRFDESSDR